MRPRGGSDVAEDSEGNGVALFARFSCVCVCMQCMLGYDCVLGQPSRHLVVSGVRWAPLGTAHPLFVVWVHMVPEVGPAPQTFDTASLIWPPKALPCPPEPAPGFCTLLPLVVCMLLLDVVLQVPLGLFHAYTTLTGDPFGVVTGRILWVFLVYCYCVSVMVRVRLGLRFQTWLLGRLTLPKRA